MDNYFTLLNNINVNEHTEKKGNLTYLSWCWAWAEIKKNFPDANYTVYENEALGGMPYFTDGKTCLVKTGVTINGIEHIEYLPIMDFKNKSIPVEQVTSMDINKAIQRSLTKACARHGLGLYIYAGEDLPEEETAQKVEELKADNKKGQKVRIENKKKIFANLCNKTVADVENALADKSFKNDQEVEDCLDKWIAQKNGGAPVEYTKTKG